uniref:Cyclase family protein n=1 Tax=Chenopodium quinoa TaxID=63459 RepID=A0A803LH07_CHEQI
MNSNHHLLFLLILSTTAYGGESCNLIHQSVETFGEGGRIIDITHRITPNMPDFIRMPDSLGQFIWFVKTMRNGSIANFSKMKFHTHTGTHVDAPSHFFDHYLEAGFNVDTLDLDVLNADVMKSLHIPKGVRRVLFRTLNTDRGLMFNKEFDTSYVGFMNDGAKWLVDNTDIKLVGKFFHKDFTSLQSADNLLHLLLAVYLYHINVVGVDYLSAAAYDHLASSHLVFLASRVLCRNYEFLAVDWGYQLTSSDHTMLNTD